MMPGVFHAPYPGLLSLSARPDARELRGRVSRLPRERDLFVHLVSPDEVAAIVVEPIQGEGGYVVAPDQFLQRLRELTRTHGMLLVVDEVQSGMGRTGRMFAIEHAQRAAGRDRRSRRGSRRGCRSASRWRAPDRWSVAARRARQHVRRQPGLLRGRARDVDAAAGHG